MLHAFQGKGFKEAQKIGQQVAEDMEEIRMKNHITSGYDEESSQGIRSVQPKDSMVMRAGRALHPSASQSMHSGATGGGSVPPSHSGTVPGSPSMSLGGGTSRPHVRCPCWISVDSSSGSWTQ